jgi:hypothetical protein
MAYRPSPATFPETLAGVPMGEQNARRPFNGLVLGLVALAILLVSGAYGLRDVASGDLGTAWQPGIGAAVGLLVGALAVFDLVRSVVFVRRGPWVARYGGRKLAQVLSLGELTLFEYSLLRTIKLVFVSVAASLVAIVGLPLYLANADSVSFVGISWFAAAGMLGLAVGLDCILVRVAKNKTIVVDGETFTLARPLGA